MSSALLRRNGAEVVDVLPGDLLPALGDHYLTLKRRPPVDTSRL
ncbi:hypothetical protein [Amycolatopsis palatopharyngis]|nr:hypothetical protein [Amycolatopsis palatopharyngis]